MAVAASVTTIHVHVFRIVSVRCSTMGAHGSKDAGVLQAAAAALANSNKNVDESEENTLKMPKEYTSKTLKVSKKVFSRLLAFCLQAIGKGADPRS